MMNSALLKRKWNPGIILVLFCLIPLSAQLLHETKISQGTDCEDSYTTLNTFPVDLDKLFWEDNSTKQEELLGLIEDGVSAWMLTPWGGHFVSNHVEGADKWYLYSERNLAVVAPHDGKLGSNYQIKDDTVVTIKGNQTIADVEINIDIGGNCEVGLGHLVIRKAINDEIQEKGEYSFTEGEHIGFISNISALDFYYYLNKESICPFCALSPSLQTKLTSLYNLQFEAAKIGGVYPEGELCNNFLIGITDTLWGVWEYQNGPFNEYYEGLEDFGLYETSFLTLLNRNLTTTETFHKDPKNNSIELASDVIGVFGDNSGAQDVAGYNRTGMSLIKRVSGDDENGIIEIITNWESEWGPGNTSVFARYSVGIVYDSYTSNAMDIEFFGTLNEAEAGFTENKILYFRFVPYWDRISGFIGYNKLLLVILIVPTLAVLAIVQKRKKHNTE